MSGRHAVVAGAGIGGLAAAVGLSRAGWQVTVLEQARKLRPVGGGIGLTPNGLHALDALGAGDLVRAAGIEQAHGGIRNPRGSWISRTNLDFIKARYGQPVTAVHRAELIDALVGLLPTGTVRTGARVLTAHPGGPDAPAEIHTADGGFTADLVVAADGIHSVLRQALFPHHPGLAYAGYTSWRFVLPASDIPPAGETWGRGKRFSILPLAGGLVHCSALVVRGPGSHDSEVSGNQASALTRYFGAWHSPVPELIAAAAAQIIVHDDIEELAAPLPSLHSGRVALLGDAAHAMTPNLGSACLALEDAVCLTHAVASGSLIDALGSYSRTRRPRSIALARLSRRLGAMGKISFPPAVAVRDAGFRLAGLAPALTVRTLDRMMGWRPPAMS
ncbi:FAD-dependent monooxygenase [Kibdelosporangium persicum]|uniref:FAD-dependent urate hydroxylase n=1 Tax=Kibdelosporangium persicum TaxID=2698649 RepID=A0ABX2FHT8_9PSEU|nr:FAD-dependent monooxygenase [Kibdelosporangium persicum]NRN70969.1 FAD-dependent urate hydroxylase [Kibdelosporangium persicum]